MVFKFIKFISVGFSGLAIDFGITFFCKEKILLNKYVANSIGFIIAASSNYIFNRIWTFSSNNHEILIEFFTFLTISIIGLLINNSLLWIVINKMKTNFYFSKMIAIVITTIWNFFANFYITFAI